MSPCFDVSVHYSLAVEEKWRTKCFFNLFIDAVQHTYQLRILAIDDCTHVLFSTENNQNIANLVANVDCTHVGAATTS